MNKLFGKDETQDSQRYKCRQFAKTDGEDIKEYASHFLNLVAQHVWYSTGPKGHRHPGCQMADQQPARSTSGAMGGGGMTPSLMSNRTGQLDQGIGLLDITIGIYFSPSNSNLCNVLGICSATSYKAV
ncbi:hypothetical protein FF38_13233 [Lucilia cuprina]|uniref:Retrotransposon gag domain-containing protein n=1 Tax=Lucilia cuprina TaxID=7375 RepID=A0A0L0C6Z4_LUCCU|nr:hypothetical protein FF38_13233 [Lucilia cuprina]